ncbi:Uncharacterised protein [Vibrio cholerae]|nr:Uncharacterised protein [Vibrio cholerae]
MFAAVYSFPLFQLHRYSTVWCDDPSHLAARCIRFVG